MSNLNKDRMKRMMAVIAYYVDKFEYDNERFMPISTETMLDVLNYSEVDEEEVLNFEAITNIIATTKKQGLTEEEISLVFEEMLQTKYISQIKREDGLEEFLNLYLIAYNNCFK